ncbi:unannotated protein [freshwater metagenome]|uniref:Unannotated protein n=1 Tax=freshwater metagenome TaxID=449393 RepID=A0A6J7R444_9ZZZZ
MVDRRFAHGDERTAYLGGTGALDSSELTRGSGSLARGRCGMVASRSSFVRLLVITGVRSVHLPSTLWDLWLDLSKELPA